MTHLKYAPATGAGDGAVATVDKSPPQQQMLQLKLYHLKHEKNIHL